MISPEDARSLVDRWRRAGAALRAVERGELQVVDTGMTIRAFTGIAMRAPLHDAPPATSGLVEFQRLLGQLRTRGQRS